MAKYATNASGAMLLINLIQVTESISGSVVPLAMFSFGHQRSHFCEPEIEHFWRFWGTKNGTSGPQNENLRLILETRINQHQSESTSINQKQSA